MRSVKLNVTFRSTALGSEVSWQQHIGVFDNEMFFLKLCVMKSCFFWKWPWTLSQTWYLSRCEQILELGTSCPAVFLIQPVFLSSWKSVSNPRTTCIVILYSFKQNTFNSGLGTNELPWYERRNKWNTCCLSFEWEYHSNMRRRKGMKLRAAEVVWRGAASPFTEATWFSEMLHKAQECHEQTAAAAAYLWPPNTVVLP